MDNIQKLVKQPEQTKIQEIEDESKESISELQTIINNMNTENKKLRIEKELLLKLISSNVEAKKSNEKDVTLLISFIRRVFEFIDIICPNFQAYVYGKFLENIVKTKELNNEKLYFLIPNIPEDLMNRVINCIYLSYNHSGSSNQVHKQTYYNSPVINHTTDTMYIINYWEFNTKLSDIFSIDIIFHDGTYLEDILFDCNNLVMDKYGIHLKKITQKDKLNGNIKYPSLSILKILDNISRNQVEFTIHQSSLKCHNYLDSLSLLNKQSQFVMEGKNVLNGFKINDKKEIHCSICYREHLEEENVILYELDCHHNFCFECIDKHMNSVNLSHRFDCPLCRQPIDFIINETNED